MRTRAVSAQPLQAIPGHVERDADILFLPPHHHVGAFRTINPVSEASHILDMLWITIGKSMQVLGAAPSCNRINMGVGGAFCIDPGNLEKIQFSTVRRPHALAVPQQTIVQMIAAKQILELFEEILALVQMNVEGPERARDVKMRQKVIVHGFVPTIAPL